MSTLTVGPGGQFNTIAAAVAASQPGDVIQVQAGTYTNDFATISHDLTLEAVGGRVNLVATKPPPNFKGYFLVGTIGDAPNVTITGFSFSGVHIPVQDGNNGAGIRYQSGNLTLNDDAFSNNQEGLLATPLVNNTGTIAITDSLFNHNGAGDGQSHNIYVNHVADFSITDSLVENAVAGHEIKSRALNTTIENDLIYEGPSGTASYSVDLPNGGNASITNNVIVKGPHSQNPGFIEYGVGGGLPASSSLTIDSNMIFSNYFGTPRIINNYSTVTAEFSNNQTYGVPDSRIASGPAAISGTTDLSTEPAINLTPPWAQIGGVNWLTESDPVLTQSGVGIAGGSEVLTVSVNGNQDTVMGGPGGVNATVSGGNDVLSTMTHATDSITLTTGAIVSSGGADTIMALAGASTVSVSGSADIVEGTGSLVVNSKNGSVTTVQGGTGTFHFAGNGNLQFNGGSGASDIDCGKGALAVTAGSGNVTLVGAGGPVHFLAGTGNAVLHAGNGNDTVAFGAGMTTVVGGTGHSLLEFINGQGGGTDIIKNFKPSLDGLSFHGFSGNPVASVSVVAGSTHATLTDGTKIVFADVTHVTLP